MRCLSDTSVYMKQTDRNRLSAHTETQTGRKCVTVEEPCDYTANHLKRYYPVRTRDSRHDST